MMGSVLMKNNPAKERHLLLLLEHADALSSQPIDYGVINKNYWNFMGSDVLIFSLSSARFIMNSSSMALGM